MDNDSDIIVEKKMIKLSDIEDSAENGTMYPELREKLKALCRVVRAAKDTIDKYTEARTYAFGDDGTIKHPPAMDKLHEELSGFDWSEE